MPGDESDYQRGQIDGKVEARLDSHDDQLKHIFGVLAKVGRDLNALVLATQHLEEAARADKETAKATAAALADAEESRRAKSEDHWTPFQRVFAGIGGLSALTGCLYVLAEVLQRFH